MDNLEVVRESKGKRFLFTVEDSDNAADYQKYEDIRYEVWKAPGDNFSGTRNLVSTNFLHDGSCVFIAVYVEDGGGEFLKDEKHLVAFSYGYVGLKDKGIAYRDPDNLVFYSLYVGVRESFRLFSLGILVKQFQRDVVLNILGITAITCTYDPLVGVNAYRNIHVFGMDIVEYRDAYYEGFEGRLNREDVPTDRFYVSWDLRKEIHHHDYELEALLETGHNAVITNTIQFAGKKGQVELVEVESVRIDVEQEFVLVEIPVDFYTMLRDADVPDENIRRIPLEWRLKTRNAFHELFTAGYKVIDFRYLKTRKRMRDFYVLKRSS